MKVTHASIGLFFVLTATGWIWVRGRPSEPVAARPEMPDGRVAECSYRGSGAADRAASALSAAREPSDHGDAADPAHVERGAVGIDATSARIAGLCAEVDRLLGSGERQPAAYEDALRALAAIDAQPARDALLRYFEDPSCEFWNRAQVFADVLSNVSDPRIVPAAVRILRGNLESGLDSWPFTRGYLQIAATSGEDAGACVVVEMLERGPSGVAHEAASFAASILGRMPDPALRDRLLAVARNRPELSSSVLSGLATWKDEAAMRGIESILGDVDAPLEARQAASETLGACVSPAQLEAFVAGFRSSDDPERRLLFLRSARGMIANEHLDPAWLDRAARDLLEECLRDESPGIRADALAIVRDGAPFHRGSVLATVERLAGESSSEDERLECRRVLGAVRVASRGARDP